MLKDNISYKPFGERAILVEWPKEINKKILNELLIFKQKLQNSSHNNIQDIVVAYHSVTIKYKDVITKFDHEITYLKSLNDKEINFPEEQSYLWEIPVCYDLEYGIDLEEISKAKNISIETIINIHSSTTYSVFFTGFLPGFLYLGGLDERIYMDRKKDPRIHISSGSVAIGGKQTGVYPADSAGGWQIIGKTPICFFNVEKSPPCFAKSGDKVKFYSVSKTELEAIEIQIHLKDYTSLKKKLID